MGLKGYGLWVNLIPTCSALPRVCAPARVSSVSRRDFRIRISALSLSRAVAPQVVYLKGKL
jgi:hypothetical protein